MDPATIQRCQSCVVHTVSRKDSLQCRNGFSIGVPCMVLCMDHFSLQHPLGDRHVLGFCSSGVWYHLKGTNHLQGKYCDLRGEGGSLSLIHDDVFPVSNIKNRPITLECYNNSKNCWPTSCSSLFLKEKNLFFTLVWQVAG